jgi:hypothetical protein
MGKLTCTVLRGERVSTRQLTLTPVAFLGVGSNLRLGRQSRDLLQSPRGDDSKRRRRKVMPYMNESTINKDLPSMKLKILDGTDKIINRWLGLEERQHYRHKRVCQEFHFSYKAGFELVKEVYDQIEKNWQNKQYAKPPSKENWRLRLAPKFDVKKNSSVEKLIEKKIATLFLDEWYNQIPTSSGLMSATASKKASIDLVRWMGGCSYHLVELKYKSNHPLFAAMEVVLYGLLYIHARVHYKEMECTGFQELLRAVSVGLRVLAPSSFYEPYKARAESFCWLQERLTDDLAQLAAQKVQTPQWNTKCLLIDFEFLAFDLPKTWPTTRKELASKLSQCGKDDLEPVLQSIKPVYPLNTHS